MPTFVTGPVQVSVPATSANLGPGFDALGLALGLRDVLVGEVMEQPGLEVTVNGMGADEVPLDESHLVYQAMREAFAEMRSEVPGIRLQCENRIPHSRGLGSSSAAIVGGICLARGLVAGGSLLMDDDAVFALADGERFQATAVAVDPRVRVLVFVPPEPVKTSVARGLLPETVPHADAA